MRKIFGWRVQPVPEFCRASLLQLCLAVVLSLVALAPRNATAGDAESLDTALDFFAAVGQQAGLPITKEELAVTKSIVGCAVAGSSVPECVKNTVIATALDQAGAGQFTAAVSCLTTPGKAASDCLAPAISGLGVTAQMPVELKPLVDCMAGGGAIDKCTEKFVVSKALGAVPPEVQPTATCMIETGDAVKCGTQFIASKVPGGATGEAGAIITCLGGSKSPGDAAQCTANYVAKGLDIPADAKPIADCIAAANGNPTACIANFAADQAAKNTPGDAATKAAVHDVVQCAALGGKLDDCSAKAGGKLAWSETNADAQAAIKSALDTVGKLKPDNPLADVGKKQPAVLRNIIMVAQGFKDNNIGLIVQGLGPELAKAASDIILEAILSPALAPIITPIVDVFIQNRVDVFFNVMEAAHRGDAIKVAEIAADFYITTYFEAPCSLIPSGPVADATCGNLAKAVAKVVELGGDLTKGIIGVGEDILDALGVKDFVVGVAGAVLGPIGDVLTSVAGWFSGGDDAKPPPPVCPFPKGYTPADYYVGNYLACLPQSVNAAANHKLVTSSLNETCKTEFNKCGSDSAAISKMCTAMGSKLDSIASGTVPLFDQPAKLYAQTASGFVASLSWDGAYDVCDPNFWTKDLKIGFVQQCTKKVGLTIPLTNPNNPAKCSLYTNSDTNGAAYQACQRALNALDLGALAGPNSAACKKKQLADVLSAPCKVVTNQFAVTIGGKDTTILEPTLIGPCYHRPQRMVGDPKFIPASGMGPADQPFHPPSLIPGTGIRPRFVLPLPVSWGQPGNGTGTGGNDGSGVVTHRPNPNQPGFNGWGGGGGGGPTAHIDPGGKPHSILQPPTGGGHGPAITNPIRPLPRGPASADLPRPRLIPGGQSGTGAGGGTGGGTNSAMDTLGTKNTDEAMHGAAGGGSGGLGDTRPLPGAHGPSVTPPPWGGRPAPLGVPKQQAKGGPTGGGTNGTQRQGDDTTMKGGGGTTNPKQPTTGGGTNGTYSQAPIKPPPGGATGNANAHPITKLKITPSTPKPPADVQIDYGGCGGCGKGDGFVAPK